MEGSGSEAIGSIRILIVEESSERVEFITRLLQFQKDFEVIGASSTGEDGIRKYEEFSPDVVLMARELPDIDGFQVTEAIIEIDLAAQVIITGFGENLPRRAIKAGASDFLISPISAEVLVKSVRDAARKGKRRKNATGPLISPEDLIELERNRRPQGKIITINSGKGGVGCTTLAVNIALALNSKDTPAVLVDADLQFGDVTAFLNQQARYSIVDIAVQADDLDEELLDEVLLLHESGLRILPAPPRPEFADEVHAEEMSKALKMLKDLFAYVIVDTASYLDDIALAALEASDLIVTVAVPEIPSIKNSRFFLDTIAELGIPKERALLVMNKVGRRDSITAERVSENLGREVVTEIPFDREAVKGAINHGKPLMLDKKTHPLVGQILSLVREIKERVVNGVLEEGD